MPSDPASLNRENPLPLSLLAAFPHPDDETFAIGGTLALYAARGCPTALVTATDGDAGHSTVAVADRAALGRVRRVELLHAAAILDVSRVFLPGFPDGGVSDAPPDAVIGALVHAMRATRPAVVVTFGPEGAPTAHRDHKALSRLVTAAYFLAGNATLFGGAAGLTPWQPARLYYLTWGGKKMGGRAPIDGLPLSCRVDVSSMLDVKRRAFEAHRTQHQHRAQFEAAVTPYEGFFLAAGVPQPTARTADLFAGLDGA